MAGIDKSLTSFLFIANNEEKYCFIAPQAFLDDEWFPIL